jgi:hypothetical protein
MHIQKHILRKSKKQCASHDRNVLAGVAGDAASTCNLRLQFSSCAFFMVRQEFHENSRSWPTDGIELIPCIASPWPFYTRRTSMVAYEVT